MIGKSLQIRQRILMGGKETAKTIAFENVFKRFVNRDYTFYNDYARVIHFLEISIQ